jgi:hypothetical protein
MSEQSLIPPFYRANVREALSNKKSPDIYGIKLYPDQLVKLKRFFGNDFFNNFENIYFPNSKLTIIFPRSIRETIHKIKDIRTTLEKRVFRNIKDKPFDQEFSIDPSLNDEKKLGKVKSMRIVHKYQIDGHSVAVKSNVKKRDEKDFEDLIEQFYTLAGLGEKFREKDQEKKDDWSGFIRPVEVYGVIQHQLSDDPNDVKQYLIEELGGERVFHQREVNREKVEVFDPKEYPRLMEFIRAHIGEEITNHIIEINGERYINILALKDAIEKRYGININLSGRDIILSGDDNGFRIIDIKLNELN